MLRHKVLTRSFSRHLTFFSSPGERRLFLALLWTASQHNQAQLDGEGEAARRAPLPLPAGHEVRLEAVEGSGGRDLAAVLEAAE